MMERRRVYDATSMLRSFRTRRGVVESSVQTVVSYRRVSSEKATSIAVSTCSLSRPLRLYFVFSSQDWTDFSVTYAMVSYFCSFVGLSPSFGPAVVDRKSVV